MNTKINVLMEPECGSRLKLLDYSIARINPLSGPDSYRFTAHIELNLLINHSKEKLNQIYTVSRKYELEKYVQIIKERQ